MTREPARTRLLWAFLSLVLPVAFGHTTACRSPALIFSAGIRFAIKRFTPCSAVLRHSPSSWAAVVRWSALIPKALRSSKRHPLYPFSWPPTQPAHHSSPPNITVLHARHKCREQDPPPAHNHLDALPSRLYKRARMRSRLVGSIVLSSTDAAS